MGLGGLLYGVVYFCSTLLHGLSVLDYSYLFCYLRRMHIIPCLDMIIIIIYVVVYNLGSTSVTCDR